MLPPRSKHGADFKILLVEDNPYDTELTSAILRVHLVCEIKTATTRSEFETALKAQPPDLILSDSNLTNFESLSALRSATQKWPDVPFVFCSGHVTEEKKNDALARGAADYISKGDILGLLSVINRFCHNQAA